MDLIKLENLPLNVSEFQNSRNFLACDGLKKNFLKNGLEVGMTTVRNRPEGMRIIFRFLFKLINDHFKSEAHYSSFFETMETNSTCHGDLFYDSSCFLDSFFTKVLWYMAHY